MESRSPASPEPADSLERLLSEWRVETTVTPSFRREVWRRIALSGSALSVSERLLLWWLSPARLAVSAVSAVAAGVLCGAVASLMHNEGAKQAYFRAIDPLHQEHSHAIVSNFPESSPGPLP